MDVGGFHFRLFVHSVHERLCFARPMVGRLVLPSVDELYDTYGRHSSKADADVRQPFETQLLLPTGK